MLCIKYQIVPKDNNCLCICIDKHKGLIKIDKSESLEYSKDRSHLYFNSKNQCNDFIVNNLLSPEEYTAQEFYIDEGLYDRYQNENKNKEVR